LYEYIQRFREKITFKVTKIGKIRFVFLK
jgi:hypothetical protein